jgi:hypothetical protein
MTQATSNFNQKYSGLATIDENGIPSRTYGQIKADIEGQIKDLQASIPADITDKTTNKTTKSSGRTHLEQYNAAKQNYDNMCALKTDVDSMNAQMNSLRTNNSNEITISGDTATANDINVSDYYQYLKGNEQDLAQQEKETRAKNTQQYKTEKQKRDNLAQQYNDLVKNKATRLANANVDNEAGIDPKIKDAERTMNTLAEGQVNDSGVTAVQYNETLQRLQGQLAKLGTEEEFNQAVNEVKSLNDEYKAALELQSAEQSAQENANAVKNNKKSCQRWWYQKLAL